MSQPVEDWDFTAESEHNHDNQDSNRDQSGTPLIPELNLWIQPPACSLPITETAAAGTYYSDIFKMLSNVELEGVPPEEATPSNNVAKQQVSRGILEKGESSLSGKKRKYSPSAEDILEDIFEHRVTQSEEIPFVTPIAVDEEEKFMAEPFDDWRRRRERSAEARNVSERKRRDRFKEKLKVLQGLIPHCRKLLLSVPLSLQRNTPSLLDDAIEYIKALQLQVQMLSTTHQVPYVLPQMQVPPQFSPLQPLTGPRMIGMYGLMPSHITTAFRNPLMLMRPLAISHSSAAGLPLFYGTGNTLPYPVHQSLHLPLASSLAGSSGIVPLQPLFPSFSHPFDHSRQREASASNTLAASLEDLLARNQRATPDNSAATGQVSSSEEPPPP
ncbi:hypothetical protein RJ639_036378 [Escallonia herrerae]|uniref:BHLH domain-containing protein n=1 Tax=Escallonia herrerae TaxID=1293975 RepID=A0AA88WRX9_9ASTE|nr:hypothetical protein RJ639_036378 [Escallonia herrerae]